MTYRTGGKGDPTRRWGAVVAGVRTQPYKSAKRVPQPAKIMVCGRVTSQFAAYYLGFMSLWL